MWKLCTPAQGTMGRPRACESLSGILLVLPNLDASALS